MLYKGRIVVTGATSGIGEALVRFLAREGWNLVLVGRNPASLERCRAALTPPPAGDHELVPADLGDPMSVQKAFRGIARRHHSLQGLFLNAGVLLPSLVFSEAGREMHFEVHVAASFTILQVLKPALVEGRATVVASGSGARRMAGRVSVETLVRPTRFVPMAGPYAASKQALSALLAELTPQWAAEGVRLTSVDLGPTKTPMAESEGMPGWMKPFSRWFASPEASAQRLLQAFSRPEPIRGVRPVPGLAALLTAS